MTLRVQILPCPSFFMGDIMNLKEKEKQFRKEFDVRRVMLLVFTDDEEFESCHDEVWKYITNLIDNVEVNTITLLNEIMLKWEIEEESLYNDAITARSNNCEFEMLSLKKLRLLAENKRHDINQIIAILSKINEDTNEIV